MIEKFQKYLNQDFSFLEKKKLLIAISAGVDSVVLTYLFHFLNYDISLAHCNFQLRDESHLDEDFVKNEAKKLNLTFYSTRFSTRDFCEKHKLSIQMGARQLRYAWFEKIRREKKCDFIITAHHLNDVMETFFINLARKTGLKGLLGIPALNDKILRPLLHFSKKEIVEFAIKKEINWREDLSNFNENYLRNKIRHQLIPKIYDIPNFEKNFSKTIKIISQTEDYIQTNILELRKKIFKQGDNLFFIEKNDLQKCSLFEIYELFSPFGFSISEWIIKLMNSQTGKQIYSKTHALLNDRDHLILSVKKKNTDQKFLIRDKNDIDNLPILLHFSFKNEEISNRCIAVKSEGLFPLILRKRKNGDFFYPTGMNGKKKVNKFFGDNKFSLIEKEKTWILCNKEDQIIWIVGHRADRKLTTCKMEKKTIFILLDSIFESK